MKNLLIFAAIAALYAGGLSAYAPQYETSRSARSNEIVHVTQQNLNDILNSSRPVIVDVYADWCNPCKQFAGVFTDTNNTYGDLYQFAKLNYGYEQSAANHFGITAFPTVIYLKNGKEVGRHLGYMTKAQFISEIKHYFGE